MRRPTIADIARRAGVTKAAVSFALNGQPGVSAATRERILAIAAEIGFEPNSAARALSDGRAGRVRPDHRPAGPHPGQRGLLHAAHLGHPGASWRRNHVTLLFTLAEDQAEEIRLYRTWWAQRKVDGVFLVDLQVRDRRIRVLEELGMPAVVVGAPRGAGPPARRLAGRPRPPPRPWSATWPGSATGGSPGSAVSPGTGTPSCAPTRWPRWPARPASRPSRWPPTTPPSTAPRPPGTCSSRPSRRPRSCTTTT